MEFLTTEEVCKLLNIGKKKAYELFAVKGCPAVKIGRDYRVEKNALFEFLKSYNNSTIYTR